MTLPGWLYELLLCPFERLLISRWRRMLWREVGGGRILEVGVGTGRNFPYYPARSEVTAVDRREDLLRWAGRRSQNSPAAITLVAGDIGGALPAGVKFDTAVTSFVFCSRDDPRPLLRLLYEHLEDGGRLLLLEQVAAGSFSGRLLTALSAPLYRLAGATIATNPEEMVADAGFSEVERRHLFADVIVLIRAEKPG